MISVDNLQHYSLFGGLLTEQVERILPYVCYETYAEGSLIIQEGCRNDSIFFLLEGRVEVSKAGHPIAELDEGQTFGEMELLDVMPSVATIRALLPVRVAIISNSCLHQIYSMDTAIFSLMVMNLARDLSRRLRRMDDLIVDSYRRGRGGCI